MKIKNMNEEETCYAVSIVSIICFVPILLAATFLESILESLMYLGMAIILLIVSMSSAIMRLILREGRLKNENKKA